MHMRPVQMRYEQDAGLDMAVLFSTRPASADAVSPSPPASLRLYVLQRLQDSGGQFARTGAIAAHASLPARVVAESVVCTIETRQFAGGAYTPLSRLRAG